MCTTLQQGKPFIANKYFCCLPQNLDNLLFCSHKKTYTAIKTLTGKAASGFTIRNSKDLKYKTSLKHLYP